MNPQDPCMINELRSVAFSKVHSEEEKKEKQEVGWQGPTVISFLEFSSRITINIHFLYYRI